MRITINRRFSGLESQKIKMRFDSFSKKKSNLRRITINMHFSKRGSGLVCCQYYIPRTNYHTKTDWIQCGIKLVHLSTRWITTENQSCYQWSAWPSNHSWVQCLHHMPQCQRTRVYKDWCLDNEHIEKRSAAWQTWTLYQISNTARFSVVKIDKSLAYIDQLELYQLMKIINMFRVGIPPP